MAISGKRQKKSPSSSFVVNLGGGKTMVQEVEIPYGEFIAEVRTAKNYTDLNELIGADGFKVKSVRPLVKFLNLSQQQLASLIGVSTRTLTRWDDSSFIGVMPSKALLEVDRLLKKGVAIFGSSELFREWLEQPNLALGDAVPKDILIEPYGIELVEDAVGAMEFGNII